MKFVSAGSEELLLFGRCDRHWLQSMMLEKTGLWIDLGPMLDEGHNYAAILPTGETGRLMQSARLCSTDGRNVLTQVSSESTRIVTGSRLQCHHCHLSEECSEECAKVSLVEFQSTSRVFSIPLNAECPMHAG